MAIPLEKAIPLKLGAFGEQDVCTTHCTHGGTIVRTDAAEMVVQ